MTNCDHNNTKMKGLLKGLRYISQIFDNEKEPEMEIGFPTDVKHVAHIGWDGPSVNTPSWMTEFKTTPQYSTSPLNQNGESIDGHKEKETETRRKNTQRGRDLPELPKSSRRQHSTPIVVGGDGSGGVPESPSRGKSDKARHRRSAKNTCSATDSPRRNCRSTDLNSGVENSPDVLKKNRRKKSKDASSGGSSKTKVANSNVDPFLSPFSDPGPSPDIDNDPDYQKPPIFD